MTRRSNTQYAYAPHYPLWFWAGLVSRNARQGILLGTFVALVFRTVMHVAVLFLRNLVLIGWMFRVSEQTALAMVLSFLIGVVSGILLLSSWRAPYPAATSGEPHPVQQYAQSRRVPDTHRRPY